MFARRAGERKRQITPPTLMPISVCRYSLPRLMRGRLRRRRAPARASGFRQAPDAKRGTSSGTGRTSRRRPAAKSRRRLTIDTSAISLRRRVRRDSPASGASVCISTAMQEIVARDVPRPGGARDRGESGAIRVERRVGILPSPAARVARPHRACAAGRYFQQRRQSAQDAPGLAHEQPPECRGVHVQRLARGRVRARRRNSGRRCCG